MSKKTKASSLKQLTNWIVSLWTIGIIGLGIIGGSLANAVELNTVGTNTKAMQEGCAVKIETTEKVSWTLPRQPIDLVILQDTSGSFKDTIHHVQSALKELTKPVNLEEYDENNPRLVFTGNEATTDRVMINTYQGIDGTDSYDWVYNEATKQWSAPTDTNFSSGKATNQQTDSKYIYQFKASSLMSNTVEINKAIDAFATNGGTPTVPAIEDTIAEYNKIKGDMKNNRKTVFLLVTDGVANGVRKDGKVILERSKYRDFTLQKYFQSQGVEGANQYIPEASQNYLARANELKEAGNKLKELVTQNDENSKNDGAVVVGFWEKVDGFTKGSQYGTVYLNGFAGTGVDTGDTRSVQSVFHEALQSIATNDKYYVNEQSDAKAFSDKILKAVAQALVKEDVSGEFRVTEGYTVESVTINQKKIVNTVKNPATEIRGTVKQTGQTVTISVPENVFKSGDNKFDYELKRVEDATNISEEDEVVPDDDYVPSKKNVEVGQLTGKFKVGTYETATIGSKTPTNVEVTDLKYCYPSVSKDVKDTDASNDLGTVDDPIIKNKQSYAANLTTDNESFTYKILYRMNNAPLEFNKNAMLVDRLDYRVEYKNAYVTDVNGDRLNKFTVHTKVATDVATGKERTIVYATIPEEPGINTDTVKEGKYGKHKFQRYYLVIEAKLKDEYSSDNNPNEYKKILQENNGLGLLNQANIIWNGSEDPSDPSAQTRRSNTVYVLPPVKTDIKKDVQSIEGTGASYVKDQSQLNLDSRSQEYFYNVESTWPGLADSYVLSDTLVPELEFVSTYGKGGAKITVNGKEISALTDRLVIKENTVKLELSKSDFTGRAIARQITAAMKGSKEPAVIKLTIKAKIRDKAELSKYVVNGEIKVPNKATVELNGKSQESNTVYVTPRDEPSVSKKINDNLDRLDTIKSDETFNFNIKTKLPSNIQSYKTYTIVDKLDERLELTGSQAPFVKAPHSAFFDVKYDSATNTVTASVKAGNFVLLSGNDTVELVIPAKIKAGNTFDDIPNTSKIVYNNPSSGGDKETPPTPPVVVTPPPSIDKKVNNKKHYDLIESTETFTYTIETQVPAGASNFVISDTLKDVLAFDGEKGGATVHINGVDVTAATTVTATGKTLNVSLSAEHLKNNVGQSVLVTFKAKIVAGANLKAYITNGIVKVPNTASFTINNDFTTKKETEPVTVTPPGETPTPTKTVDNQASLDLTGLDQEFTYQVKVTVPQNVTGFTKFDISDDLEDILTVKDIKVLVAGKEDKVIAVTTVEKANTNKGLVVATIAKDALLNYAGKEVTLEIKARIKEGVKGEELAKYVTPTNTAGSIPNKATLTVGDKPSQKKETEEVPVTPPADAPNVSKKINDTLDNAVVLPEADYTYNVKSILPKEISTYKKFVIFDDVDERLTIKGTPVIKGEADKFFKVTVTGQTVTAEITDFDAAKAYAAKEVELVITSQVKKGATVKEGEVGIPNQAKVQYRNKIRQEGDPDEETPPTPPVTVTPPPLTKKINDTLEHLDIPTKTDYKYNIKTAIPTDITSYKKFVITDTLDKDLMVKGTPTITGVAAKFFVVKVDGQTVTATLKDFANADEFAGKQVELVIPAQIREGVSRVEIPNITKVVYNNSTVDEEPDKETPPTPPVTVTPPGETPTPKKTVDEQVSLDLTGLNQEFTYRVKATVPQNVIGFTKFDISDDLEDILTVTETSATVDGQSDAAVKVTSVDAANTANGKVVASLPADKIADYKGKEIVLTIKARIKAGVTSAELAKYVSADNTSGSIPNKAKLTVGDKPEQSKDSNEVPVTPPGENPTVSKKVNETLDHLDIDTEKDYTYNITSTLPVDIASYKKFVIADELDKDLVVKSATINGDAAAFFDAKVDGQTVTASMKDFKNAKDLAGKTVELVIVSQIRAGVTRQAIPNTTKVVYQNKSHVDGDPDKETPPTPPVTVTPPGETPTVEKKINGSETKAVVLPESNYTYNITSTLPSDITRYKAYSIVDDLDDNLAIQGTPVVKGDAAKFFDVTVTGNKVTATMKNFKDAKDLAGKTVELVITSQVKATSTAAKIDNTAKVTYQNKSHVDGTPDSETPPTPPVTVTPPPVTKKINETLDHLDTATQTNYNYNIKTTLPSDIASYKTFVITDELEKELAVQGTPTITGEAAKFFNVAVKGQVVTATIKDFEAAKAYAGKEVELVIVSQIREGVTRQAIPNQTTSTYTNKANADGTPGPTTTTPPTPPVTVTPPGETPTVEKKINKNLTELNIDTETDYNYNITTTLPVDIASYKKFAIVDVLEKELVVQGTPTITGDAAKFFDVKVEDQTVTATMKNFKDAKELAGKEVELVIVSQIREGVTRQAIPNTTKVTYQNKSHVDGTPDSETPPTPPVTVTPPPTPNQPPITKKVNNADSATLQSRKEVFTYTIDTTVPTGAVTAFEVTDTLKDVLTFEGAVKATVNGQSVPASQITSTGQDLRVVLTKEQARANAGKAMQVVFSAKIKDGADLRPYMTDGQTSIPNTANYIINNDPGTKKDSNTVPVVPPTPNEPGIDKKINRTETHLDIPTNKAYMYNVNADIPSDIATYREFVVTDTLVDALAINGEVVAYVDGYSTDAVKVTVEGNRVVATVVDFAKLAGYKQLQLYIPAYIKEDADLTPYVNNGNKIPNTANLDFTDSNSVKKHKDTVPVTVTPPTPNPPTPPTPEEPTPEAPKKTVSGVDGKEQALSKLLAQATDAFRFDIHSVIPADQTDDKRMNLTSLTVTDNLDALFTVKKEQVAVKVTGTPAATANFIDEDVEKAQAALDAEKAKLDEINASSTAAAAKDKVTEAQATVADLEAQLTQAKAKLAELKAAASTDTTTPSTTDTTTTTSSSAPAADKAALAEQEKVVTDLEVKVTEAKATLTKAQETLATAKTEAEVKVEAANQQKVVDEKQKALDQAKDKQAKLQAKLAELAKVNEKGELTSEAIAALGGTIKVEGQLVTVDFSDEYTMEALKGRKVSVIIYSSIKDVKALKDIHFTKGIENTATVQFNHNPDSDLTKKTNPVKVYPPKPKTPTPPPTVPEKPKGELPTPPTPQAPTPKKVLPRTGSTKSDIWTLVGLGIAGILAYAYGKKRKDI